MALVNLACTVEAFADAGLEPEELLAAVHPALVANTQGAGMGGMASLRRLLLDHLLVGERQNDRVQESLGNVVAAHAVQTYLGSYGPMIHPVGACATAAVSLEVAYDKIASGGALAVLAGGFDDLTPEGMIGFADMGATASSDDLEAMGLAPHEASRANDVRRAGFVEAQGGGAQLVVRGDVALALGLPVRGVLAYAGSFADGLHASIPAPGMGALASAPALHDALATPRPDRRRPRRRLQARHVDRDERPGRGRPARAPPGRARPHARQPAARRLAEDGHGPRQGRRGRLAGGRRAAHARDRRRCPATATSRASTRSARQPPPRARRPPDPLAEPLRAALVTCLGFGHVSAVLAIAHPDMFLAAVPGRARDDYLARAGRRRAEGVQRRLDARLGRPPPPSAATASPLRASATTEAAPEHAGAGSDRRLRSPS